MWGPLGEFVIAGHENGEINQYSAKVGAFCFLRPKYTSFFYAYVSVCAQSYAQPCNVYLIWLVRIHRRSTHALLPNCNTSPSLAGPVGSSYEDYSVMKDTVEKLRSPVSSGKASHEQVLQQAIIWEAGPCLSLFWRCVKPMFMQFFFGYLVNRYPHSSVSTLRILITAREFNAHVRPSRLQKSGVCAWREFRHQNSMRTPDFCTLSLARVQSELYFGLYTTIQKFGVSQIFLQINNLFCKDALNWPKVTVHCSFLLQNICCSFELSIHQRIICHVSTKILCRTTVFNMIIIRNVSLSILEWFL